MMRCRLNLRTLWTSFLLLLLLLLIGPLGAISDSVADDAPSQEQVVAWLRELEPLPKVHHSFPLDYKKTPDELLYEYVRITHAAALSSEWHNRDEVDRAVSLC
ncbi:MAG: hypothetical protein ACOY3P_10625, partial [Planctomycetota bacterium]